MPCCGLVPGGMPKRITAARAARVLAQVTPAGAAAEARCELAAGFLQDLRRIDDQMQQARKKLAAAVQASGTTLTEVFGVGPVIAAIVIGEAGDVTRFAGRDHFAACNGTAPIEVSSGNRKVHRLSRRGNRRLNHAVHMAAVTQVSQRHSEGRAYYDKKIAEGKTAKEALRALKRQVSDTLYKRLKADAARAAASIQDPGGQLGTDSVASAARLTPRAPALRPSHSRACLHPTGPAPSGEKGHVTGHQKVHPNYLTQRGLDMVGSVAPGGTSKREDLRERLREVADRIGLQPAH